MAKILKASWDFSPLFKSDNDHNIEKERKTAVKKSYEFIKKWKNNSEYLSKPDTLKIALDEYNEWLTSWGTNAKENYYFDLRFALFDLRFSLLHFLLQFLKPVQHDVDLRRGHL